MTGPSVLRQLKWWDDGWCVTADADAGADADASADAPKTLPPDALFCLLSEMSQIR